MSDSTSQGGAGGDFRGSREEKRQDETVMITSDNLSDLVNEAKATAPAATPTPTPTPAPELAAAASAGPNLLIIVIGVVLILAVVIALVYSFAKT